MPGDYPDNWKAVAKLIKDLAVWKCDKCGHVHDPKNGYMLTVHHRDGDKRNNQQSNLRALCQRCHLQAQARLRRYGSDRDQLFFLEVKI